MNFPLLLSQGIRVVVVTKGRTIDEIRDVLDRGLMDIGENRLPASRTGRQEAMEKLSEFPSGITKHFIGRLQTNKVREAVRLFDMIQSVDRLPLAQKIEEECSKIGKIMPVLIQVNTSNESQKGGCRPEEAVGLAAAISALPHLELQGLMTVALESKDPEKVRPCFKTLKRLFDEIAVLQLPHTHLRWLSMGMSDDYKIALEEGANMLRIGRLLFNDFSRRL
ncbi:MAG: YggS family pyridoxal phosphate-dependent enzyme [Candidatus Peregrinibacteria bacterium]